MRSKFLRGAGGVTVLPVQFLSVQGMTYVSSDAARSITLNTGFQAGDFLLAVTSTRTSTPAALLSGYTNILTTGTVAGRGVRVQYKIATTTSETINFTGATGYIMAFRNVKSIGQTNILNTANFQTTHAIPDLTGLDDRGTSYIWYANYLSLISGVGTTITTVSSPYQVFTTSGSLSAYVENNTSSSLTGKTVSYSASNTYEATFAIELKATGSF